MRMKLTLEEYNQIEELVNNIINTYSKKDAESDIRRLEFLRSNLGGYTNIIFGELISYTKNAAGRVQDKDTKISFAKQTLYKLKFSGVDD